MTASSELERAFTLLDECWEELCLHTKPSDDAAAARQDALLVRIEALRLSHSFAMLTPVSRSARGGGN